MLTPYDDFPCHQAPLPFESAGSSDPRFFDRYWFAIYDRDGRIALNTGLGVYRNSNVLDGFASAIVGDRQYNVRVSRILRPDYATIGAGPLSYQVLEGLKTFRLKLDANEHDIAFDLVWDANFPAFEEAHHARRYAGYVLEDYHRFYQFGSVRGWIEVAGERFSCDEQSSFFGFRDRSFGIRPGVGGPMPPRAPDPDEQAMGAPPSLRNGYAFAVGDLCGCFQFQEDHLGRTKFQDGTFVDRDPAVPQAKLEALDYDIRFEQGTIRWKSSTFELQTTDGRRLDLLVEPLCPGFAYQGYGYYDGYRDQRGLGAFRGAFLIEGERYNVADPTRVIDESGSRTFPAAIPLEYPVRVTCDGEHGYADSMLGLFGPHPKFEWKSDVRFETF